MFTQSMPALAQALSGALPEAALRQLMQSLGNCQQPLTHRGAINLQPPGTTGAGGLARPGTWRVSDYTNIMPKAGDNVFVDMAGDQYNRTDNSHNYDGNNFSFPLNQDFNYNNYYGGDTFNVAGNSNFDNSTHNTLNAGDLNVRKISIINRTNNYTTIIDGDSDGGGGGNFPGGGGGFFPGPGFPMPGVPLPAENRVATYLKDVTVTGSVDAPTVDSAKIKDSTVTLTPGTKTVPLTVTGTVEVPVAKSGSLAALTATGQITIPTVTGGTLSGAKASGTVPYDTYPTATCGPVTGTVSIPTGGSLSGANASGPISYDTYPTASVGAVTGTVSVPTSGSFSATPTGIAASATTGTLAGQVTFDIPTGGYLDASCKLVLTTASVTKTVVFSGAPSVSITSQGTVSGTVSLSGDTNRSVTIFGPSVTLNKKVESVTPTLTVSGGTVTLSGSTNASLSITAPTITPNKKSETATADITISGGTFTPIAGSSTQAVTVTTTAASVTITTEPQNFQLSATGEIQAPITKEAALANSEVSLTPGTSNETLKLKVGKKSDFLIYLRPRA